MALLIGFGLVSIPGIFHHSATLSLTDPGRELCNNATVLFVERQRELMQPLDYEERRMFEALLKKALMDGPDGRRNL